MKKWSMLLLAAALLCCPMSGQAEEAKDFLSALTQGIGEGVQVGAQALADAEQELTLTLSAEAETIEEGNTRTLTITAGNPLPRTATVRFTLELPDRLSCAQPLVWEAELEAAKLDPVSGRIIPTVKTFAREVTLARGGESETAELRVEMAMGTRFYRAQTQMNLCVPNISASAALEGAENGRVQPGHDFAYVATIANDGTAAKDVTVEMVVPEGAQATGVLPEGLTLAGSRISGTVRAEAGGEMTLRFAMQVKEDALEGDEDAMRLMSGLLAVDGVRTAMPRIMVCGPKISVQMIPEAESLEVGEEMDLQIMLVNSGLAGADVQVSCLLPEGLTLVEEEKKAKQTPAVKKSQAATPDEAASSAMLLDEDDTPPSAGAAEPVIGVQTMEDETVREDGALVYSVRMEAAKETDAGVSAAAQTITLRVKAETPQKKLSERLLGTALAWQVDGGETNLSEAVAVRVVRENFLGMTKDEVNGVLLAGLLLIVTVCCLYAAVKADEKEEYVFD